MSLKILVVDDSKLIRQVIRQNIESLSVLPQDIIEAIDGVDGVRKMSATKDGFNLIITDLQMPNMDGIEFIKRIRTLRNFKDARVVAISGQLSEQSVGTLERMGVMDFVKKPFDLHKFMTTIKPIIKELKGQDDGDDSKLELRSEFIKSFQNRSPKLELFDGILELKFDNMRCKITLDNFLKSAIFEK